MPALSFGSAPRRVKKLFAALFCALFALLLILVPGPVLDGARRGLSLCGSSVIPSLFPFLVLSSFIIGSGLAGACGRLLEPLTRLVFGLPGCAGLALALGAVGGYPVGADAVSKLCADGALTKKEAQRLLCFAINSSPAFIIGAVGAGFFGSTQAGILLYCAHLAASCSIGLLLRFQAGREKRAGTPGQTGTARHAGRRGAPKTAAQPYTTAFVGAVTGAAGSIVTICAFVVLFSALNALFDATGVTAAFSGAMTHIFTAPAGDPRFFTRAAAGILEVTNGCAAAAGANGMPALLLTAAMLGFSGLSVQFQVIAMIRPCGARATLFLVTRFLHAALSVLFTFLLFTAFPAAMPKEHAVAAFALNPGNFTAAFHSAPAVCAMLFICAILLLSLAKI